MGAEGRFDVAAVTNDDKKTSLFGVRNGSRLRITGNPFEGGGII